MRGLDGIDRGSICSTDHACEQYPHTLGLLSLLVILAVIVPTTAETDLSNKILVELAIIVSMVMFILDPKVHKLYPRKAIESLKDRIRDPCFWRIDTYVSGSCDACLDLQCCRSYQGWQLISSNS